MGCVHNFKGDARCENCGLQAIGHLTAKVSRLDLAARYALGYIIHGDRAKAEEVLREAITPHPDLPTIRKRRRRV